MPKITNKSGIPEALVRAVETNPYNRGECDFSITQLINPPRIEALKLKHKDEIEEDAADQTWALLGQALHVIAERAARPGIDIAEKRFFAEFSGVKVSGQIDLYEQDTKTLNDFKVTKAWAFSKKGGSGQKPEYRQQLNMQAELMRLNGLSPKRLRIIGILRDFDEKQAGVNGYPLKAITVVEMPLWSPEETLFLFNSRIKQHLDARKNLPPCSAEETWGGRRCKQWCNVNKFCSQYAEMKKTGVFK